MQMIKTKIFFIFNEQNRRESTGDFFLNMTNIIEMSFENVYVEKRHIFMY